MPGYNNIVEDATGSGDVTAGANLTDNAILRGDGGAKGIQDSGWLMSDTDVLTGAGDLDMAASSTLSFNSTGILVDAAGTMTLSNVDALDATTESTIEAAIDTLTLTSLTMTTAVTSILDEDTLVSDSATALATQQSIKAYVDAQVATADTLAEVLTIGNSTGGTNIVVTAGDAITVDTINETTAANGVVVDGITLKDGGALAITGGTNTFNLTNGTASLDVAAASAVNIDANLTVESASLLNQDLTTDATGVQFASFVLGATTTVSSILDEDTLVSDSATALATQQSIKAYVDAQVGSTDNTLDEAYDQGGAGAGRSITADSGAVEITVSDTSNNQGLVINQNDTTNGLASARFIAAGNYAESNVIIEGTNRIADLQLYRNDSTPNDDDSLGILYFAGNDSALNKVNYALVRGKSEDVTDTEEDGQLDIRVLEGATTRDRIRVRGTFDGVEFGGDFSSSTEVHLRPMGNRPLKLSAYTALGAEASSIFLGRDDIILFGNGATAGVLSSNGNFDLTLQTGNATTSSLTITDGANGDITATLDGTGKFLVSSNFDIGSSTVVSSILDEDTLVSDSATALATQQSIKAYVDNATPSASTTTAGVIEVATAAETTTGTDATRAVSPDGLAGSDYGKRVLQIEVFAPTLNCATGDGKRYFRLPSVLNGYNLVDIEAQVVTAGTTGTMDIQIHNVTDAVDVLSTKVTIDSAEIDSSTAATPPVINTANDDVDTADQWRIDIDAVHTTPAKGLVVELTFQLP